MKKGKHNKVNYKQKNTNSDNYHTKFSSITLTKTYLFLCLLRSDTHNYSITHISLQQTIKKRVFIPVVWETLRFSDS